jgi:hypothetical protein
MLDDLAIVRHKCSLHLERRGHNDSVRRVSVHVFSKKTAADSDLHAQWVNQAFTSHKRVTHPTLTITIDLEAALGNQDSNLPAGDDADVQAIPGSCGVYRADDIVVKRTFPQD